MLKEVPEFTLYDQFSEFSNRSGAKLRFVSIVDVSLILSFDTGVHASFKDKRGKEWMRIEGDKITIFKRYAWNGCSPKKCIFGIWVGTIDTESNVLASFFHDALCQFFNTVYFPFSKEEVDLIFYNIMYHNGFILSSLYYKAVKRFGNYEKNNSGHSDLLPL